MPLETFTLIDAQRSAPIAVAVDGADLRVTADSLAASTGWSVKPEGFCRGPICVPAGDAVTADGLVDLAGFAQRIGRPLAVDAEQRAVSLGAAAADRAEALRSLEAPEFTLPDLTGVLHSLSDYRGRKILLAAYASW